MAVTDKRGGWDKDPKCNPRFQQRSRGSGEIKMLIRQSSIRMGGIHDSVLCLAGCFTAHSSRLGERGGSVVGQTDGGVGGGWGQGRKKQRWEKKLFAKPEIDAWV